MTGLHVAKRVSVVLVAAIVLAATAGWAQQAPGRAGRGGGGQQGGADVGLAAGGAGPVNAYAYADCSSSNAPVVSVVVVTGPVPANVPASTPQPSVKFVLNASLEGLSAPQSIGLSPDAAKGGPNAMALSCPVVGDCVPAGSGTLSIQRRADDGALWGNYQATWPGAPPRTGRFTAVWRESQKKCG
jgi:hypothetical protein